MIKLRQQKLTLALVGLIAIFAGCKSETPTTPSAPNGNVTPPTGANVTVTVSNPSPVVNSNVIITATVTQNNQPVANGTGVQFNTNLGTFTDTGTNSTVRTTTNGVAQATLTSPTAGNALVTITVNNVVKQVTIPFGTAPTTTPPTSTAPTITAVTPATAKPQGGDTLTITGTNFTAPVRVLFQSGTTIKEGFVCGTCVTPTSITVVTPAFDVPAGGSLTADVIVITQAGTAGETRVVKTGAVTIASPTLTPTLTAVNPATGPSTGGTRITITGSGFQAPVQVTMGVSGSAGAPLASQVELQVLDVTFTTIHAITPEFRLIDPTLAAGNGSVALRVLNIGSAKDAVIVGAFRFLPKMAITTVGPTEGPFTGGTRVRIDGIGFDQPLAVTVAGVAAQVISVSGSQVIVLTSPVNLTSCGDVSDVIQVMNTDNGDSAIGPKFIYRVPKPLITNIANPANLGGTTTITVLNALGFPRITIGGIAVQVTGTVVNPDGTTTFTVNVPANLPLTTQSCPSGGSAPVTSQFDVIYTSAQTGCTDTAPKGLTVNASATPVLFVNPPAFQPFNAAITQAAAPAPPFPGTSVNASSPQTVSIVNTGGGPLNITAIATANGAGSGCAHFAIAAPPVPPTITLNTCEALPIIVTYNGQTTPETATCTLTVTTNAGVKNLLLVGTSQ